MNSTIDNFIRSQYNPNIPNALLPNYQMIDGRVVRVPKITQNYQKSERQQFVDAVNDQMGNLTSRFSSLSDFANYGLKRTVPDIEDLRKDLSGASKARAIIDAMDVNWSDQEIRDYLLRQLNEIDQIPSDQQAQQLQTLRELVALYKSGVIRKLLNFRKAATSAGTIPTPLSAENLAAVLAPELARIGPTKEDIRDAIIEGVSKLSLGKDRIIAELSAQGVDAATLAYIDGILSGSSGSSSGASSSTKPPTPVKPDPIIKEVDDLGVNPRTFTKVTQNGDRIRELIRKGNNVYVAVGDPTGKYFGKLSMGDRQDRIQIEGKTSNTKLETLEKAGAYYFVGVDNLDFADNTIREKIAEYIDQGAPRP